MRRFFSCFVRVLGGSVLAPLSVASAQSVGVAPLFVEAPTSLDLEAAMDMAATRSLGARLSTAARQEVQAREGQTKASALPRLDLDATQAWNSKSVNKLVGERLGIQQVPDTISKASLTLAQPLIGLGAILLKIKADARSSQIALHEETLSKRDARFQGADAFLRAIKAQQLQGIATASLSVVDRQRKDADAQFRAGRLGQADLMRLELALSDARTQLTQAQATREIALVSLAETIGLPEGVKPTLAPLDESLLERKKVTLPTLETALAQALSQRPDIKAAAERVEIAETYALATRMDYLPSLNAFAKYERDFQAKDVVIPAQAGGPRTFSKEDVRDTFTYGLSFKWTLWDWGVRNQRIDELSSTLTKASLARDGAYSKTRIEVTAAVLELKSSIEALESSKTSVKFAEEIFRLTNIKFTSGTAAVFDLVQAERDQTRARAGFVNARGDVDLAWFKFQRATGSDPTTK